LATFTMNPPIEPISSLLREAGLPLPVVVIAPRAQLFKRLLDLGRPSVVASGEVA